MFLMRDQPKVAKTDFDDKLSNLNRKITKHKTDLLLVQNELNKLKTLDLSYFIGKNYFEEDGAQNYLVFQPLFGYFIVNTIINVTNYVLSWQSKGLSASTIKPPAKSNNSLTNNKLLLRRQNKSKTYWKLFKTR